MFIALAEVDRAQENTDNVVSIWQVLLFYPERFKRAVVTLPIHYRDTEAKWRGP